MNKLCKEHLKGLTQDWKNYKLSKKEVIERIEILAEICYTQGLTQAESNEKVFLFSRVHRPLIDQLQVMKDDRDFS